LSTFFLHCHRPLLDPHSFPTRRSSDLLIDRLPVKAPAHPRVNRQPRTHAVIVLRERLPLPRRQVGSDILRSLGERPHVAEQEIRSEEHTSELQSRGHLVCRLLLEKKKK